MTDISCRCNSDFAYLTRGNLFSFFLSSASTYNKTQESTALKMTVAQYRTPSKTCGQLCSGIATLLTLWTWRGLYAWTSLLCSPLLACEAIFAANSWLTIALEWARTPSLRAWKEGEEHVQRHSFIFSLYSIPSHSLSISYNLPVQFFPHQKIIHIFSSWPQNLSPSQNAQ